MCVCVCVCVCVYVRAHVRADVSEGSAEEEDVALLSLLSLPEVCAHPQCCRV